MLTLAYRSWDDKGKLCRNICMTISKSSQHISNCEGIKLYKLNNTYISLATKAIAKYNVDS